MKKFPQQQEVIWWRIDVLSSRITSIVWSIESWIWELTWYLGWTAMGPIITLLSFKSAFTVAIMNSFLSPPWKTQVFSRCLLAWAKSLYLDVSSKFHHPGLGEAKNLHRLQIIHHYKECNVINKSSNGFLKHHILLFKYRRRRFLDFYFPRTRVSHDVYLGCPRFGQQ